jgi:hypothetical protein
LVVVHKSDFWSDKLIREKKVVVRNSSAGR